MCVATLNHRHLSSSEITDLYKKLLPIPLATNAFMDSKLLMDAVRDYLSSSGHELSLAVDNTKHLLQMLDLFTADRS